MHYYEKSTVSSYVCAFVVLSIYLQSSANAFPSRGASASDANAFHLHIQKRPRWTHAPKADRANGLCCSCDVVVPFAIACGLGPALATANKSSRVLHFSLNILTNSNWRDFQKESKLRLISRRLVRGVFVSALA